jgi:hypothetical protein
MLYIYTHCFNINVWNSIKENVKENCNLDSIIKNLSKTNNFTPWIPLSALI